MVNIGVKKDKSPTIYGKKLESIPSKKKEMTNIITAIIILFFLL